MAGTMPPLRLLSLDGGGVRGLSSLIILDHLMEAVDSDNPPKPGDYFDMIGGTSTGGIIAIMLGRLGMTIQECIDAYLALSSRVFEKEAHRVHIKGKIQGRFDSTEMESAIFDILSQCNLDADTLLKDTPDAKCKVFACATSKQTSETVVLTSYKSPHTRKDLLDSVKIWEACRATSATSTFFDPIAIGRYREEFVDGATGANNPIQQLWNEAQSYWGPEGIEDRISCIVSIGTGIPPLTPFRDDVLGIGSTLAAISTETEQTAERFKRDKPHLFSTGNAFRFNVVRGLEDIGLEESKKQKEIAAATGRYVSSSDVVTQMTAFASNPSGKQAAYHTSYSIPFSLRNIPISKKFVDRPADMQALEETLLPTTILNQRKIFVLHGLGGIGKTQLAVKFMRMYHTSFSAVIWLDGSSKDILEQGIASCAGLISDNQISMASREYARSGQGDRNTVVKEVLLWFAQPDNDRWLIVFDNVDRDYRLSDPEPDPLAYDIKAYIPIADHGSILITTRLVQLGQIGDSHEVKKVNLDMARTILETWYKKSYDLTEGNRLLEHLDGLPLAIAQAGAFLQENGMNIQTYLGLYEQQQEDVAELLYKADVPLQDYTDRSVWTTWTISYKTILARDEYAANLLILWSYLDRNDLWYGLFEKANRKRSIAKALSSWLGKIASSEASFFAAVSLLYSYSLIEGSEKTGSYSIHAVVHRWAYFSLGQGHIADIGVLAVLIVGHTVPRLGERDYALLQRRIVPHTQCCNSKVLCARPSLIKNKLEKSQNQRQVRSEEIEDIVSAIYRLGFFYYGLGILDEAEKLFLRTLQEYGGSHGGEQAWAIEFALGRCYRRQEKYSQAEMMLLRVLQGREAALGSRHAETLRIVNHLGKLYSGQKKYEQAEKMFLRALQGGKEAVGDNHIATIHTIHCLGDCYRRQGKLDEAEEMLLQALKSKKETLGNDHISTMDTLHNLGLLYMAQGKSDKAEKTLLQALQAKKEAFGDYHQSTRNTIESLGTYYYKQRRPHEAEKMFLQTLQVKKEILGDDQISTVTILWNLGLVYEERGKFDEAEQMLLRALKGYQGILGIEPVKTHVPALEVMGDLGRLYSRTRPDEARYMYSQALSGFTVVEGASSEMCYYLQSCLKSLNNSEQQNTANHGLDSTGSSSDQYETRTRERIFKKLRRKLRIKLAS